MEYNMGDLILFKYDTHTDYLNSFVTSDDKYFLHDDWRCRQIVELGFRSSRPILSSEDFEKRKENLREALFPKVTSNVIYSKYLKSTDEVLLALKARELLNVYRMLSTIIFIKSKDKDGFDISGYIDFSHSLRNANLGIMGCTDWQAVFEERKRLMPKEDNLSFYDVRKKAISYTDSTNYKVMHDPKYGVMFMHRGDNKLIPLSANPPAIFKNNVYRSAVYSATYGFVVLYDHKVRKIN